MMNEPEQTLWMSVLSLAMQDLSGPDHLAKPARAWLCSKNNALGSLIWICDQIGLNPDAVRQNVLRRRAAAMAPKEHAAAVNQAA
jgi:hypothetical protein